MLNFFKNKNANKEIVSLDRPIIVDGEILRDKLNDKSIKLKAGILQVENILVTEYAACIEGSMKAEKRRELQKVLHDYKVKSLWVARLLKVIENEKSYALTLMEAISLGFVEDAVIE